MMNRVVLCVLLGLVFSCMSVSLGSETGDLAALKMENKRLKNENQKLRSKCALKQRANRDASGDGREKSFHRMIEDGEFASASLIAADAGKKRLFKALKALERSYRLGIHKYKKRKFDSALPYLLETLDMMERNGWKTGPVHEKLRKMIAESYFSKGRYKLSGRDYSHAFLYFKIALRYGKNDAEIKTMFSELKSVSLRMYRIGLKYLDSSERVHLQGPKVCVAYLSIAHRLVFPDDELFKKIEKAKLRCFSP